MDDGWHSGRIERQTSRLALDFKRCSEKINSAIDGARRLDRKGT